MRKFAAILAIFIGLILCGCGNGAGAEQPETENGNAAGTGQSGIQNESAADAGQPELLNENTPIVRELGTQDENTVVTDVTQGGPYGEISISIPDGWNYEVHYADSDGPMSGMYGICFYPEGVTEGYVELAYFDFFGVCGTGLAEEKATVAGNDAYIGTYDNHEYWDFISFRGECEGVVALTYSVGDWWGEYVDQVMDILDTLSFDQNVREGTAYIYSSESQISEIGLSFSLKNISSTGATLVFHQYDADAPKGELIFGDDYFIEVQRDGKWESVPVVIENAAFNAIAYVIVPEDSVEQEISWEWLYGKLAPGEYRIVKSILESNEGGGHQTYMICAQFILEGEMLQTANDMGYYMCTGYPTPPRQE